VSGDDHDSGSTAVLLCVPEAEPVVHGWRSTGDPSASRGVPAHVTLLSPFLPADRIDAGVLFLEPAGDGLDELAAAWPVGGRRRRPTAASTATRTPT
jgi:hypothetical protein